VSDLGRVKWIGGGKSDSPGAIALRDAGIEMTGWVLRDRTLQELSQSAIYLHWTAWDGLPLSILEAMALDVIVVASDIGPNREVLGPAQVCATENEAVELIRNLADSDDLRRQFLASQRERGKGYGSSDMVARWSQVYHRLLLA
jgi:glycosyltransferase involved in cell wall biosynthesis